jgi:ribosomal protein S15P/S13E
MNNYQRKINKLAKYLKSEEYDEYSFRSFKILARQLLKVFKSSPFRKKVNK